MPSDAVRQHVGQRAHEHAHLAVEGAHAAERLLAASFACSTSVSDAVRRQRRRAPARTARARADSTTGPAPGPPPPCGVEKVLCRLMCMASTPRSPGRTLPTMALKLAPSAVEVGAGLVHGLGDRDDVALEQPAGVRVGQHDGGDIGRRAASSPPPDRPCRPRAPAPARTVKPMQRRGRRVGAVRRIRHQHDAARSPRRAPRCAALIAIMPQSSPCAPAFGDHARPPACR